MNHQDSKTPRDPITDRVERIAGEVVDAAFKVHSALGPGLLESVYELCLAHELTKRGLQVQQQIMLPVLYDDLHLDAGFRIDMVVDNCVLLELKAVEKTLPVHQAQILTYLKLSGHRLGLLINFNVPLIKDGIQRFVL